MAMQLDSTERETFSHLLRALQCGAPPHGGFAIGMWPMAKHTDKGDVLNPSLKGLTA